MMRMPIGRGLRLELRSMGIRGWVPIAVLLLWTLSCVRPILTSRVPIESSEQVGHFFTVLGTAATPFAAWWSIYLMERFLEAPGGELFFTYPAKRIWYGFARAAIGFLVFSALLIATVFCIQAVLPTPIARPLLSIALPQSLFYAGLGFLVVTLVGNTFLSLMVVMVFALAQVLVGPGMGFFSLLTYDFYGQMSMLLSESQLRAYIWQAVPIALFVWIAAVVAFQTVRPRNTA